MDAPAKQQIIERIKSATNILVTVSNNPSVDQLAACIGMTLLLNKIGKFATAVFSGTTPSTIEFLQPEKTLNQDTNSLQDFIISLDKSKADKLRYKVEDQVVKIFITPYQTQLNEKDLNFSYGEVNVEIVLALGVKDKPQLDKAITSHGRILHDATIISMMSGDGDVPSLGQINWRESSASSLSEMLVSLSEAFGSNLIDNQIATAFLTGIVAETARFSNSKTSPKVMTMSAQLMAAGANQQLVVSKLATASPEIKPKPETKTKAKEIPKDTEPKKAGVLSVAHLPSQEDSSEVEIGPNEIHIDEEGNLISTEEVKTDAKKPGPEISTPSKTPDTNSPGSSETKSQSSPPSVPMPPSNSTLPDSLKPSEEPQDMAPPIKPSSAGPSSTGNSSHALLDPSGPAPATNNSFSASTNASPSWQSPYNSVPIDPLNNPSANNSLDPLENPNMPNNPNPTPVTGTASMTGSKVIEPPKDVLTPIEEMLKKQYPSPEGAEVGNLSLDSARNAVESAYAGPGSNLGASPASELGSTPMFTPPGSIEPPTPPPPIPPPPFLPGQNGNP